MRGLIAPILIASALLGPAPSAAERGWAGFYAPSGPLRDARGGASPPPCAPSVPALSAVPALGDPLPAGAGCGPPGSGPGTPDPTPPRSAAEGAPDGVCVAEIRAAEARYGIPDNLLLGIGLQEAGIELGEGVTVWPWSVNIEGEGRFLRDAEEAIAWARERRAAGAELIDVGCMQINLRWHPDAFASLEEAFDPARNVDYAARYLLSLVERTGGWRSAVGRYHSADPDRAERYLAGVDLNLRVVEAAGGEAADRGPEGGPSEEGLGAYLDALVSDAPAGAPRPLWSAGLGARPDADMPAHGIYGPTGLRAVLPAFRRDF